MKVRKSAMTLWVLVLPGMVIVSGCGLVVVETPTPETVVLQATQTAIALAQLEVELKQTQTALAATQTAMALIAAPAATPTQAEQAATPTPVSPTATPEATDTPTVGPTDTPSPTDIPAVTPTATPISTDTATAMPIPVPPPTPCSPSIEFTDVPPIGDCANPLKGLAQCVRPAGYKVTTYIFVPGWGWVVKPSEAEPYRYPNADGEWDCDIVSEFPPEAHDEDATRIAVFLTPKEIDLPVINGASTLPERDLREIPCRGVERLNDGTNRLIDKTIDCFLD